MPFTYFKDMLMLNLKVDSNRRKRWVEKETVIEFLSGIVAIEGYFQSERVDPM